LHPSKEATPAAGEEAAAVAAAAAATAVATAFATATAHAAVGKGLSMMVVPKALGQRPRVTTVLARFIQEQEQWALGQ
jgi:methyl coenzyme M reductase alpha subunit